VEKAIFPGIPGTARFSLAVPRAPPAPGACTTPRGGPRADDTLVHPSSAPSSKPRGGGTPQRPTAEGSGGGGGYPDLGSRELHMIGVGR